MPRRPKKPCSYPGCPELVEAGQRFCNKHKKQEQKRYDQERGTAAQRGYNSRWRKARKMFLKKNPLCAECQKNGRITPATVVDHIRPHRGNPELFWDESNWQPLCKYHHDVKTAKQDGGFGNKRTNR
ncbi:MAG: HNH endonuclease [Thermoanaerobacteraceae bacterium]|nr:HNH endonuclease [Thermoanaerobacteraceae bacterium]